MQKLFINARDKPEHTKDTFNDAMCVFVT